MFLEGKMCTYGTIRKQLKLKPSHCHRHNRIVAQHFGLTQVGLGPELDSWESYCLGGTYLAVSKKAHRAEISSMPVPRLYISQERLGLDGKYLDVHLLP